MFARSLFQAAHPFKQQSRRYATNPPTNGGTVIFYAGLASLGGAAYWYLNRDSVPKPEPSSSSRGQSSDQPSDTSSNTPKARPEAKPNSAEPGAPPSSEEQYTIPEGNTAFKGGDQGFLSLKLDSVELVNHNTKKFRFLLPNPQDVGGLPITSALLTKYKGPEDTKPIIRPYTPVSAETDKGILEFVIKKYKGGPMSTHLHNMEPGQRLDMKGPIPKYPWAPNKHSNIALIAGGTGITPMYQLANAIFSNPNDKTRVTLIFGNVTEDDILLKREFEHLENTYPNRFRAFYVLDNPPRSWQQGKGHITKELLKQVLPFEPKDKDGKIFVCGPPGMYKAISGAKKSPSDQGDLTGYLKELGYEKEQVYKF